MRKYDKWRMPERANWAQNPEMDYPTLLAEGMDVLGINRQEVASRVGVSPSLVSRWLAARRTPGRRQWGAVADMLGIPVERVAMAVLKTRLSDETPLRVQLTDALKEIEQLQHEIEQLRSPRRLKRPPSGQ